MVDIESRAFALISRRWQRGLWIARLFSLEQCEKWDFEGGWGIFARLSEFCELRREGTSPTRCRERFRRDAGSSLTRKFREFVPSGERKVPCVWFPKLDGISGASLPGKLAVLVRGDFCSASWKTTQDSTYMSDAFGRNVGESSAVSSGPLNDTEESSSPRADSTARLHQTERRGWGSPKRAHGCISLSRFIYNNWSDRATHERSRQHIVNGAHPISDHYIRLWIPHDIADITRSRINIYLDDLV